jgi:hypothetical protein
MKCQDLMDGRRKYNCLKEIATLPIQVLNPMVTMTIRTVISTPQLGDSPFCFSTG